jgi:hypothetical protein
MKYKFTGAEKNGLKQIQRLSDRVTGGWIESEKNLSQDGNAWVYGDAWVSGDAWVASPLYIQGSVYSCTMSTKTVFKISCEAHTFQEWEEFGDAIAEEYDFSKEQKAEYLKYIALAKSIYGGNL